MAGGFVAVPVIPVFKGMSKEFAERLEKPAKQAGQRAGKSISEGVGGSVENLERQVKASSSKLESLDRAYEKSAAKQAAHKERVEAATLKLQDAEEKYQAVLEQGGKGVAELSKVKTAKAQLIDATEKLEQAENDTRVAEEKHRAQLDDLQTTISRYDKAQDDLADQLGVTRQELQKMGGDFSDLDSAMEGSGKKAKDWSDGFASMLKPLGKLGGVAVGLAGVKGIAGTLQDGFAKVTSIEDTTASLKVLMGSAEDASDVMDQLKKSNEQTPYSFDAWAGAGKNLIAFGVDAEKVSDIVTSLGEAASSSGKGEEALNSMADAFGKAAASGKISMQTLHSLSAGGVEGLRILANEYGVTTDEMQKMISKGAVSAEEGIDILTTGIREGSEGIAGEVGAMSGVMDEMAKTTSGRLTNMKAAFNNAAAAVLGELSPLIAEVAKKITDWTYAGIKLFKEQMLPVIQDSIEAIQRFFDRMSPALEIARDLLASVVGWLKDSAEWLIRNKDWVVSLAVAVGTVVGVYKTWIAYQKTMLAYQKIMVAGGFIKFIKNAITSTKLWTEAQRIFNAVMKANPVGLLITAIVGLVAGLTWFFTKTETGRKLWEQFTTALSAGWQWFVDTLTDGWQWVYDNVFSPMSVFMVDTLLPMVLGAWDKLKEAWQALSEAIQWVWENVIKSVWEAITDFVTVILWPTVQQIFQFIKDSFAAVGDSLMWVWDNVIKPTWDAFGNALLWLWDNIVFPVIGFIQDRWEEMGRGFNTVKDFVIDTVFGGLQHGLETVKGWFETGVEGIRLIWDGLRAAAAKPVRFVIEDVWNNGILAAWNKIAGFLPGIDKKDPVELGALRAYAQGGVLPGYSPGRDIHRFFSPTGGIIELSGGEAIMRPEWTRAVGGPAAVAKMNADAKTGRLGEVSDKQLRENKKILKAHQAFAAGGVVEAMTSIILKKYPMMQLTSGWRPTNDNHGRGLAGDFSNGFANTPEMLGLANDIADTYPGSMELIHEHPAFDRQIKNGAFVGGGGGSWGFYAGSGNHANHVHWAMNQPPNIDFGGGVFKGGSDGAGRGGVLFSLVKKIWDGLTSPIKTALGNAKSGWGDTDFATIPGAVLRSLMDSVWGFLVSKIPFAGGSGSGADWEPGAGAEQWRGMLVEAFRNQGEDPRPDLVDALVRQIHTESGGDPNIAQQIVDINGTGESAGVGLSQVIPTTWQAYRDPSLPDNRRDPWANTNFMVRYFRDRHNYDTSYVGQGHGWKTGGVLPFDLPSTLGVYDQGGWLPHGGMALNQSGKPEPVFTAAQWQTMSDMIRAVGELVPALKHQTDILAKHVDVTQAWLVKAQDSDSREGIIARSMVSQLAEIAGGLGLDSVSTVTSSLLGAERDLLDARAGHNARLADIAEKEKAVEDIRGSIAQAQAESAEVSEEDQKKLAKAEQELAQARKESVKALDMPLHSLVPQVYDLARAGQAAASDAGLGAVAGVLSQVAALAGPAGVSVGVVVQGIKSAISVIKTIVGVVKGLVETIRKARLESRRAMADAWSTIVDYASLAADMQANISVLQQSIVRGMNEQRTAEWNLKVAQQDRIVAEAEGALAVAQARLDLDTEIANSAKVAQIKLMGLYEDWDSYLSYEALAAQGALAQWSDATMSAFFAYEQARAQALQGELQARAAQIRAEAELASVVRQNTRNQQDLLKAQERLIRMSAGAAGVDLVEATGTQSVAKLMVEMAQVKQDMDSNTFGRWGYKLGANGSFANEYRGQVGRMQSLQAALDAVVKETGVSVSSVQMDRVLSMMAKTAGRGGDPLAVLRAQMPDLIAAETALKINESLRPVFDARDEKDDIERKVEDLKAELDLYDKVGPLEETIKGLDYTIKGLESASKAWQSGNEKLRGDYLHAVEAHRKAAEKLGVKWKYDDKYATDSVKDRIYKEVTIYMDGNKTYTADQVDKLLSEVVMGSGVSLNISKSSSVVAASRRGERV